jgi:hypothetical protein
MMPVCSNDKSEDMVQTKMVVTLGTPRSGTSAITRGLQVLGVNLGYNLMPPSESFNAKGFWEDLDIYELNVEMLSAIKSDWAHVSFLSKSQFEELRSLGFVARASKLLREKSKGVNVYGFKDPRVAKLLPFWESVFDYCGCEPSYVIALRNPMSIARSLEKFFGMDATQSYLIWLEYTLSSMSADTGRKRVIVDYDLLMQDPEKQLYRIASALSLTINEGDLEIYMKGFLDNRLRHSIYGEGDLLRDEKCPKIVAELYHYLSDMAEDNTSINDCNVQHKISILVNECNKYAVHIGLVDRFYDKNNSLSEAVAERDIRLSSLSEAVAERDIRLSSLSEAVAERDICLSSLNEAVAERDSIKSSRSWRITIPLRTIANYIRSFRQSLISVLRD